MILKNIHKGHAENVPYFVAQGTDIDVSHLNYKKGTKKKMPIQSFHSKE